MSDTPLILVPGQETNFAIEKKLRADALAAAILKRPSGTPERWKAIRSVWYGMDPNARQDHADAVAAAAAARETMIDKDLGRTEATRGKAYDQKAINGQIYNSLVAIMPETLKAWLVKYDPYLNKNVNKGAAQQRKAWRKLYKTFPEYRTTLKQETF